MKGLKANAADFQTRAWSEKLTHCELGALEAPRGVAQLLRHFGQSAAAAGGAGGAGGAAGAGGAGGAWAGAAGEAWRVQLSMLQLHPTAEGELLLDLLQPGDGDGAPPPLKLREWHAGREGGERCWPEGLTRLEVHSNADFEELLAAGYVPCISLYLPISPHTSPYLPISRRRPRPPPRAAAARARRAAARGVAWRCAA